MKFINLHGHTSFSNGDGHGTPLQHVQRVKELGMSALALTEHGNTSSHVQLEQAAVDAGIKPIFGCELYVALPKVRAKFHQTVLAMNKNGYRQLNRLVSQGWERHFSGSMSVAPGELLTPQNVSDLIVLSGCADSWLSCMLAGGKSLGDRLDLAGGCDSGEVEQRFSKALRIVEAFQKVYGDRYYLELQPFSNYDRTCFLNEQLQKLHELTGVPLVSTADVHYHDDGGWKVQQLANAIGWGKSFEEVGANRDYAASECTYPTSDEHMTKRLVDAHVTPVNAQAAIDNTQVVADRCNVVLPKTKPIRVSDNITETDQEAVQLLRQRIKEGFYYRMDHHPEFKKAFEANPEGYRARIVKELKTIIPKGFADYFLVNQQIILWAKRNGIVVGPGRGSAAGSLVCYLLQLTEINPMLYPNMLFERFLDPARSDAPDIDTDYQDDRRSEIFAFAREMYGDKNVGNIGNFNKYRGRTAVKDTARALNIPLYDANKLANLIGDAAAGSEREFNTAEDAVAMFDTAKRLMEKHPGWELAFQLEGDQKTMGVHAAGMVLSNTPISDTCAIYRKKKAGEEDYSEIIAFDKRDAAYLNMLKLDCLGLSTMAIIADVIDMVPNLTLGDMYRLEPTDTNVLMTWVRDDLVGIFQFEGRTTRGIVESVCTGLDKTSFSVLSDINALSRPGAMTSGMTNRYIKVSQGGAVTLIHPVIDKLLADTHGCLVYQEQVMRIGKEFGGLADDEIGRLRKIIGAKQQGGAFEAFWAKFRDGAMRLHGVEESKAREVWEWMAASSSYLFNIAHSISYALVAYWCAYLKTYYPVEFFVASARVASGRGKVKGKVSPEEVLLRDALAHGFEILPPDIAHSGPSWTVEVGKDGVKRIRGGLSQIEGLGQKTVENILRHRDENEGVVTWDSLQGKVRGLGPKTVEKCKAFCASADPYGLSVTGEVINIVNQGLASGRLYSGEGEVNSSNVAQFDGRKCSFVGRVLSVTLVDALSDMAARQGVSRDEVYRSVKQPRLQTKARVVALDEFGKEFRVTVSRFVYPKLRAALNVFDDKGVFGIAAVGKVSADYGVLMADNLFIEQIRFT